MSALSVYRTRIAQTLQDTSNVNWSTGAIDEALRQALEAYSAAWPYRTVTSITLGASPGREIALSSLTGLTQVDEVIWPYTASTNTNRVAGWQLERRGASAHLLLVPKEGYAEPANGDVVRVWWGKRHTIDGLDSASATTVADDDETLLVAGACGYAATQRALDRSGEFDLDTKAAERFLTLAAAWRAQFEQGLAACRARRVVTVQYPAGSDWTDGYTDLNRIRRRVAVNLGDHENMRWPTRALDEAIRSALHDFQRVCPYEAVDNITLGASPTREIALSGITNVAQMIVVKWVVWPYSATDPTKNYVASWRLDIRGASPSADTRFLLLTPRDGFGEPREGDIVRLWWGRTVQIAGLDSAATTYLPTAGDDETVLVAGACAYAVRQRLVLAAGEELAALQAALPHWSAHFGAGLGGISQRRSVWVNEPQGDGWALDKWDGRNAQ